MYLKNLNHLITTIYFYNAKHHEKSFINMVKFP